MKRKPLAFELNPTSLDDGFTQSEMTTWDNCPELWFLRYNLLLQKPGVEPIYLTYGSWVHDALERFYKSKGKIRRWSPSIDEKMKNAEDLELWNVIGEVQTEVYFSRYKHDFTHFKIDPKLIEVIGDIRWKGIRLKGMLDALVWMDGGWYVLDHKTSARIDKKVTMGWDFRFQFMFYVWLASKIWPDKKIKGFIPNVIKKPEIKRGVHESARDYAERVRIDMRDREDVYFWRDVMLLKPRDIEHFENEILLPKVNRIKFMLDPEMEQRYKVSLVRSKNTDNCLRYGHPCEFLPLCRRGFEIEGFQYEQREVKHNELELQ